MSRAFGPARTRGELSAEAAALLPERYRDGEARRAAVDRASERGLRDEVRGAIIAASAILPPTAERREALSRLGEPNVSMVVTGQQVGLFVGPLYSLWKAATAIAFAERLTRETASPVVPVFWLQTEDHDLAEVASSGLSDARGGVHTARVSASDGMNRVAIAHRCLGDDIGAAIDHVASILAETTSGDAVIARVREAWCPGRPWAEAFADLLGTVFSDTPLLVLQPRTPALSAIASPIHEWALSSNREITARLRERATLLEELGFTCQVPVRSDCALSFFHADGAEGPRYRLRSGASGWLLADGEDRPVEAEVRAALVDDPMRFSSSALLRPLVQDTLLPTAAYVGGPGELSYWAQLPPLYESAGLPLPLVLPRATGTIVDAEARSALQALDLTPNDVDCDVEGLLERLGPPADAPDFGGLRAGVREALSEALADARRRAQAIDEQAERHFSRIVDNADRDLTKLVQRLERAVLRADETRLSHVRRAVARLRPGGGPQDRASCWPDVAARVGLDAVGPALVRAADEALAKGLLGQPQEVSL